MSDFEIRINGQVFDLWQSATVYRSIDDFCGTFTFSTTNKPGEYPVKLGDRVQVLINGQVRLTGYVFTVAGNGDINSDRITISGRDITADIVDSSIPENAKNITGSVSLKSLCETVISGLGASISVRDDSGGIDSFSVHDSQAGASGGNAFRFLESFARKRQIYLITSPVGEMVLFRPGNLRATSSLLHQKDNKQNNIKSWSFNLTHKNQFNTYIIRSQDNIGFDAAADYSGDGNNRIGTAIDERIRASRYFEGIAEETMDDNDCTERAKEEANIRRARGLEYNCIVAGAEQIDGSLWQTGQLVNVLDDFANVQGTFLIRSVRNSIDINSGTTTQLTLALPDAYQVKDVVSPTIKRKANLGEKFES